MRGVRDRPGLDLAPRDQRRERDRILLRIFLDSHRPRSFAGRTIERMARDHLTGGHSALTRGAVRLSRGYRTLFFCQFSSST